MNKFPWNNLKYRTEGFFRSVNYHTHGRLFTPTPKYVCFRITKNCNSKCVMCSDWKNRARGEITAEEVRQVFSNPLLKHLSWVNVLGGEPTIRQDLPDIIQAIYENVTLAGVTLNTNGFVTETIVKRVSQTLEKSKRNLSTRKKSLNVVISVDGLGDLHDEIRGVPKGFEKICKTIEGLQALRGNDPRLSLGLTCCVQPKNIHGLSELQDFAKGKGVPVSFFPMRFAHVFGNLHDRDNPLFHFSPLQRSAFEEFIRNIVVYRSDDAYRWAWDEHFGVESGRKREFPCLWLYSGFMLFPDGKVTLCDSNPEQVIGNIHEKPIDAILKSWQVVATRVSLRQSICQTCSFTTSDPSINLEQEFWYKVKHRFAQWIGRNRMKLTPFPQKIVHPMDGGNKNKALRD